MCYQAPGILPIPSLCPPTFRPLHPNPLYALQALHAALRSLEEQHGSVLNEGQGYRRQLAQQRQRNEQAADVVERLVAQAARVAAQVEDVQQRQQKLTVSRAAMWCVVRCFVLLDLGGTFKGSWLRIDG